MRSFTFPDHPELDGRHAPFPASSPSWLNYDDTKVFSKCRSDSRKELGTELHAFCASYIRLGDKLTKNKYDIIRNFKSFLKGKYDKKGDATVNSDDQKKLYNRLIYLYQAMDYLPDSVWETVYFYISECVNFRMMPERHLFYSYNFFGTADAVSFDPESHILRISDLKTGDTPGRIEQLYIYAAYACMQLELKPDDITIELRIYQSGDILLEVADKKKVIFVMEKVKRFDDIVNSEFYFGGAHNV